MRGLQGVSDWALVSWCQSEARLRTIGLTRSQGLEMSRPSPAAAAHPLSCEGENIQRIESGVDKAMASATRCVLRTLSRLEEGLEA